MKQTVKIYMDENWFKKDNILDTENNPIYTIKVLSTPKKGFFRKLLEIITFKWYRSPVYYKCKILEDNQDFINNNEKLKYHE